MNHCYRFHPIDAAMGENERFYARMAERGWLPERRGAVFSRFRRSAPQALRFRVEYAQPAREGQTPGTLAEEQRELYEACGWQFAAGHGLFNLFCAPEDAAVPELHTDPGVQADTLSALRRSCRLDLFCAVLSPILWVFVLLAAVSFRPAVLPLFVFAVPSLLLLISLFLLGQLLVCLHRFLRTRALYRQLSAGVRDSSPGSSVFPPLQILCTALLLPILLLAVLTAAQFLAGSSGPLPEEPDGPFLTLSQLGYSGERISEHCSFHVFRPLWGTYWETKERLSTDSGVLWLDQTIVRRSGSGPVSPSLSAALRGQVSSADPSRWEAVSLPGLDQAWLLPDENVAVLVKGDTAASFRLFLLGPSAGEGARAALLRLAAVWSDT